MTLFDRTDNWWWQDPVWFWQVFLAFVTGSPIVSLAVIVLCACVVVFFLRKRRNNVRGFECSLRE